MVVVAGFSVKAEIWKSLVAAYAETEQAEYYWEFNRRAMKWRTMDLRNYYMIDFRLSPVDYRSDVDSLWVRGPISQLVDVSKRFRKGDQVRVEVRDREFWVGAFQVGTVVDVKEVEEYAKIPIEPKPKRDVALGLAIADFRGIVKKAEAEKKYEYLGFKVKEREATIMFFNDEFSRIDLRGYREPWCYSIEGEGESGYSLELFSKILYLGFTNTVDLIFEHRGVLSLHYRADDIEVRFWLASVERAIERFEELLARPTLKREQLWVMKDEDVRLLEKSVKAIGDVTRTDDVSMAMLGTDFYLYWILENVDKGYFKASHHLFEEFRPPASRLSGVFSIAQLGRFLSDVEELTCFLEGEPPHPDAGLVLVGTGRKIAPKELKSVRLTLEIEVPEVRGVPIFGGSMAILEGVMADAEDAGDEFLVFVSTPFELVAFGRDAVYYRASLPIDTMQVHVEEGYIPIPNHLFRGLRSFFSRFPATVTLGKESTLSFNLYLELNLEYKAEIRALIGITADEVERAVTAYKEEFKKPPPPPLEYVKIRALTDLPQIVAADLKVHGPFYTGNTYELPKPNAEAFVKQGVVSYEVPPPPPPMLSKEEIFRMYDEEWEKRVKQQIEFHTPYFTRRLLPALGPEWEEATIALFTAERVMEKFKEEISVDRETVYKTYLEAYERKPEVAKIYLEKLSERLDGFATGLVRRYEEQLFEEAKEKARAPPPVAPPPAPPPKPEIPSIPAVPGKLPPISEEEGVTDEWLEAVKKIDPRVKPEVITHPDYTYSVLLNKWIEQLQDSVPMGVMPLKTPPEVEAFLDEEEFDGWTWSVEEVTYSPEYSEWRTIYHRTYTREDLEALKVDELKLISGIKGVKIGKTKEEMIANILGVPYAPPPEVPPAPPFKYVKVRFKRDLPYGFRSADGKWIERHKKGDIIELPEETAKADVLKDYLEIVEVAPPEKPPKPPKVVAPPPTVTGLQKADENYLRDLFTTRLKEGTFTPSRAREHVDEFRVLLRGLRDRLKDRPRSEAVKEAEMAVQSLVDDILIRYPKPPVRPPEVPAVPVPPARAPEVYIPPAEVLGPRTRRMVVRRCWIPGCPETFEADEDLEERVRLIPVMKADTPTLGPRYEPLLRFPPLFYFLCPTHREERFGYKDVLDALAHLYFETHSSMAKRLTITKETFGELGLTREDMITIQSRAARFRPEEEGSPEGV